MNQINLVNAEMRIFFYAIGNNFRFIIIKFGTIKIKNNKNSCPPTCGAREELNFLTKAAKRFCLKITK